MADLAIRESDHVPLVHRAFLRNAAQFRNVFRPCVIDNSTGPARTLTWGKTLVAALCVTRYLRSRLGDAPNVGVWLPTSLGGALANIAIAFLGKASVNLNYTGGAAAGALRDRAGRHSRGHHLEAIRGPRAAGIARTELQVIYLEDVLESVTKWQRIRTFLKVLLLPGWVLDRSCSAFTATALTTRSPSSSPAAAPASRRAWS